MAEAVIPEVAEQTQAAAEPQHGSDRTIRDHSLNVAVDGWFRLDQQNGVTAPRQCECANDTDWSGSDHRDVEFIHSVTR